MYAERDYSVNDLPKNRVELFFDCIRQRPWVLLRLGLLSFVFLLPLLAAGVFVDLYEYAVFVQYAEGLLTEAETASRIYSLYLYNILFSAVGYGIAGVAMGGVMNVIRQLVWGEGVFFFSDFIDGVKKNGLCYLITFLLSGSLVGMIRFTVAVGGFNFWCFLIADVALLFFLPLAFYVLAQSLVYREKYIGYWRNGIYLYGKTILKTLAALIVAAIPLAVSAVRWIIVRYILLAVESVLVLPLVGTGLFLFSCNVFDRWINMQNYPELVDKGLYRNREKNQSE